MFLPLTGDATLRRAPALGSGVDEAPADSSARTRFPGSMGDFSPDGRYIAYQSDESGRSEIYIRPFPRIDNGRWQVSTAGGTRPVWARSGRELFYLNASNAMAAVDVSTSEPTIRVGTPAILFDTQYSEPNPSRHFDVSAGGQRILMFKPGTTRDPSAPTVSVVVVEHWFEELKQQIQAH
jgi:serine/threonine-protein kinase